MKKASHASGAFKRRQKQEREARTQKLPKIDGFLIRDNSEVPPKTADLSIQGENNSEVGLNINPNDEQTIEDEASSNLLSAVNEDLPSISNDIGTQHAMNVTNSDLGHFINKALTDQEKMYLVQLGPFQPSGPFPKDPQQDNRSFSSSFYESSSGYGPVNRFWLCYSQVLDAAYCHCCWLFRKDKNKWCSGIRDWKHLSEKIRKHSTSSHHVTASRVYEAWQKQETIDKVSEKEIQREASFWKLVLQRLFDIVITLARNSLPLRGHREQLLQEGIHGNFLSLVNLLAKYDPILQQVVNLPKGKNINSSFKYESACCFS